MQRLVRRYFGAALTTFGIALCSGCDYVEDYFATSCGSNCSHHHDHDGHHHDGHESSAPDVEDTDGHTHVGPNGGRLIVLGDEDYHAELVIDHEKAEATVCVLDCTGRKPVCVDQHEITLNVRCEGRPHQIRLIAVEASDVAANSSSCFRGTSDVLRGECQLAGRLNVIIRGKPYTGHVAQHSDDHKLIR